MYCTDVRHMYCINYNKMNLSTSLLAVDFHKTMTHSARFKILHTVYYYGCQKKKKGDNLEKLVNPENFFL